MTQAGGLAFVNLEGLYARYEDASAIIERVVSAATGEEAARVLAAAYDQPPRDDLITALITRIKARGGIAAVSTTPASAWHHAELAAEAGADLFLVQSQVTRARHLSASRRVLPRADPTGGRRRPAHPRHAEPGGRPSPIHGRPRSPHHRRDARGGDGHRPGDRDRGQVLAARGTRIGRMDQATVQDWLDRYVDAWRRNERGPIE